MTSILHVNFWFLIIFTVNSHKKITYNFLKLQLNYNYKITLKIILKSENIAYKLKLRETQIRD